MKRRSVLRSLLAAPGAAAAMPPQTPAQPAAATTPAVPSAGAAQDTAVKLELTPPDAAAPAAPGFLSPAQFAALKKLCGLLVPPYGGMPGAVEAGVPEFLDFLLRESTPEKQRLFRDGLDRFAASPGAIEDAAKAPWSYYGPADPFSRFIQDAKQMVLTATMNSREYAQATRGRRGAGLNYYWRVIE